MERLTKRISCDSDELVMCYRFESSCNKEVCEGCEQEEKVWNKLAEYEDAEEQGLLVNVVHGEWIYDWNCSICGEDYMQYADADSFPAMGYPLPNYCPNCGAKMDLKKEAEHTLKEGVNNV